MPPKQEDRTRQLIDTIKQAFSDIAYPGDEQLVVPSRFEYDTERRGYAEYFRGRHWSRCSIKDRDWFDGSSYCVLTPAAYRFYLPAYLLASIQTYREADLIPPSIVHSLTPPVGPKSAADERCFLDRTKELTSKQRQAIKEFLEYLRDQHPDEFSTKEIVRAIRYYE